jgi:hypothetical protein
MGAILGRQRRLSGGKSGILLGRAADGGPGLLTVLLATSFLLRLAVFLVYSQFYRRLAT